MKTDNMFISQEFEMRFILKFCLLALSGSLLSTSLILYYCSGSLTTSFDGGRVAIRQTSLAVFPGAIYTNLIMLFLAAALSILLTLYLSKSIRRPLFRFREDIQVIADGDLTKSIHYRSRDLTTSLAQNINKMTSSLNARMQDIETGLRQTIENAPENTPEELIRELTELQRGIKENFIL